MEQLNDENTAYLIKLIDTLHASKIDAAVIGEWGVGAMTEGSVYAMVAEAPEFPGTLALTRIGVLKARLDLVKKQEGFGIGYEIGDNDDIRQLVLFAGDGDTTVEYRCGMADGLNVPKRVLGDTLVSFEVSGDMVGNISHAVGAFKAKDSYITFESVDDSVVATVKDDNGDEFRTTVCGVGGDIPSHSYSSGVIGDLLNLASKSGDVIIGVGDKGILSIVCDEFTFYVMASKV